MALVISCSLSSLSFSLPFSFPLSIPLSILVGGNFERRKKARRSRNSRGDSNRAKTLRSFLGVSRAHADADLKALLLARPWGVSKSTKDGLQDQCRLVPGARNARIKRCACPSTPHTIDAHTVAHGSRCIRPHACNARHHCLPVSTHSLSHAMRITTHGLGHKHTKASCARKPHAHAPLTGTIGHVNTDHTRMPSHALSTAHASCVHASCDGHGQCEMVTCTIRPCMRCMPSIQQQCEMRMADGNNILYYMMNIGRMDRVRRGDVRVRTDGKS